MPKDSPRPLKKYKIENEQTKIMKLKNDNDLNK